MFLAAAPYFQKRFQDDPWILENFQSAIISVSTLANMTALIILANIQYSASYPFRIMTALVINVGVFSLLTVSTSYFLDVSPPAYLAFALLMAGTSAWATGLIQNGAFAFAASFGRPEYTQALMAGQGVAGVLPSIALMVSVLLVPDDIAGKVPVPPAPGAPPVQESGTAALFYFLTAVVVSVAALAAFAPLRRRHNARVEALAVARMAESVTSVEEAERAARKVVGLPALLSKLRWPAAAVFACFAVTMFFPVFTVKILSVRDSAGTGDDVPRLFRPAAFIPLAFFVWNAGDLLGRVATALPCLQSLRRRPAALLALALARLLFLPLYALCNVRGRGAAVPSDAFYLLAVQLPFGLTNGWIGSSAMMAGVGSVDEGEREVAGGFMGLCLVSGLAVGSLLSFTAAGI